MLADSNTQLVRPIPAVRTIRIGDSYVPCIALAAAQLDAVVAIATRAYATGAHITHFESRPLLIKPTDIAESIYTGGDAALVDAFWRSMINAGVHSGVLYVASTTVLAGSEIRPEAIHSIGLWFPPGKLLYST
jgi:hypothetical protein